MFSQIQISVSDIFAFVILALIFLPPFFVSRERLEGERRRAEIEAAEAELRHQRPSRIDEAYPVIHYQIRPIGEGADTIPQQTMTDMTEGDTYVPPGTQDRADMDSSDTGI